jgi:hypothetical protein
VANTIRMSDGELRAAIREARGEAAPFAIAMFLAHLLLALVSREAGWELFGRRDWWIWLVVGTPSFVLAAVFVVAVRTGALERLGRALAIGLLGLVGLGAAAGIGCVVVSLLGWQPRGAQLLASAAVVLFTNVLSFGLVFWELDSGGPVARAGAPSRSQPDFQFPQDENPQLAKPGWSPRLFDYVYVSVTNSIAFSPTDAMPLTHRSKLFMGLEAAISATTVLVVAARAINVIA